MFQLDQGLVNIVSGMKVVHMPPVLPSSPNSNCCVQICIHCIPPVSGMHLCMEHDLCRKLYGARHTDPQTWAKSIDSLQLTLI